MQEVFVIINHLHETEFFLILLIKFCNLRIPVVSCYQMKISKSDSRFFFLWTCFFYSWSSLISIESLYSFLWKMEMKFNHSMSRHCRIILQSLVSWSIRLKRLILPYSWIWVQLDKCHGSVLRIQPTTSNRYLNEFAF